MATRDILLRELLRLTREAQDDIPLESLDSAAALISKTIKRGNHVWVAGNGGSAATAAHLTSDLVSRGIANPQFGLRVRCLSESTCLLTALANDHGWETVYRSQLAQCAAEGDTFVVFSVLGGSRHRSDLRQSLNLLLGLQTAQELGCKTVGIVGASGGSFAQYCDVWIGTKHADACIVEPLHSLISHLLVELVIGELRELASADQEATLPTNLAI